MPRNADSGALICTCLPLPDGINESCPDHGHEPLEDAIARLREHESFLADHYGKWIAGRFAADLRLIERRLGVSPNGQYGDT